MVRSRKQLVEALEFIQSQQLSWIVEVESSVKENSETHRSLSNITRTISYAFKYFLCLCKTVSNIAMITAYAFMISLICKLVKIICRHLQNSTKQAIKRALQVFERTDGFSNLNLINFIIQDVVFHRYRCCHDLSILSAD